MPAQITVMINDGRIGDVDVDVGSLLAEQVGGPGVYPHHCIEIRHGGACL